MTDADRIDRLEEKVEAAGTPTDAPHQEMAEAEAKAVLADAAEGLKATAADAATELRLVASDAAEQVKAEADTANRELLTYIKWFIVVLILALIGVFGIWH